MNLQSEAFQVGDQVTIFQPYIGVGVGRVGTITRIYHTHPPHYRVRFAHIDLTVHVPGTYLAHVHICGRM